MASIQGIYIALFGRPADPKGLAFFEAATKGGADLSAIGDLAGTEEYQSRFKGMDQTQIVTAIYKSLLGREPEPEGLAFWVEKLASKSLGINTIAIAVLDGARGTDRQTVAAKVKIADAFTASLDTPEKVAAYVGIEATKSIQSYLAGITAEKPGSTADLGAILTRLVTPAGGGGSVPAALNVALKASDKQVDGTALGDTISGTIGGDSPTFGSDKVIDGGAGIDTLKLSGAADLTLDGTKIKNIERMIFTGGPSRQGAITPYPKIDLSKLEGVSEIGLEDAPQGTGITLQMAKPVPLSLTNTQGTIQLLEPDLAGAEDRLTVTLDRAGEMKDGGSPAYSRVTTTGTTNGSYEAIALTSTGERTNYLQFDTVPFSAGAKLTIDGTAGLYLSCFEMVLPTTIDASKASGGVTLDNMLFSFMLPEDGVTVRLGSGDDTVIHLGEALSKSITLDGGAGTDRLWVNAGSKLGKDITNFEILKLSYGGATPVEQSAAGFKTVELVPPAKDAPPALTLTDLANGTEIAVLGRHDAAIILKTDDAAAQKSVTLKLAGQEDKAGVETLKGSADIAEVRIVSGAIPPKAAPGARNVIGTDEFTVDHIITGSGDLEIASLKAKVVNASTMTGALRLTVGDMSKSYTIATGSGDDYITVGTNEDKISTGAGDDTIRMASFNHDDEIDGGDGNDTLELYDGGASELISGGSILKNIETLRVVTAKSFTLPATLSSGMTPVIFTGRIELEGKGTDGSRTVDASVVGLGNNANVGLKGFFNKIELGLHDANGSQDRLNLRLDGLAEIQTGSLDVAGLEVLNIDVVKNTDLLKGPENSYLNYKGNVSHTITGAGDLNLTTGATRIDASAMTGKLNLTANASGSYEFTLGTGADTVKLGAGGGTLTLGKAGGNAQTGADTITLGDGSDKIVFVSSNAGAGGGPFYDGAVKITGFTVIKDGVLQQDKLAFSANDADFSTNGGAPAGLAKGAVAGGLKTSDRMGVREFFKDATITAAATDSFFKLTAIDESKNPLADAIGSGKIQGLAKDGNYLVSYFDAKATDNGQTKPAMVLAVVNAGTDGVLTAEDVAKNVSIVGILPMDVGSYSNFGETNLAVAL